jgi:acyl-CoA dehydrogenase
LVFILGIGDLINMASLLLVVLFVALTLVVVARGMNALVWEIGSVIYLIFATFFVGVHWAVGLMLWAFVIGMMVLLRSTPVRGMITDKLFARAKKAIPRLSKTEEEALNAGDTWIEKSIFIGAPDWDALAAIKTELTDEEQSFLDHETETFCAMLNEWEITQKHDLSPEAWAYLKEKGFLGLVIPKAYGGKGFSARAHSDVVLKIASRSGVAAVTVMVPNSLGPGELLCHYGTQEQKDYYLPRLAAGIDIPCFALTEPEAGSDATSIHSEATVMKKTVDGKSVLGLSLTLNKRWITLAPVATLIGLAVNLKDPEGLLKGNGEEGITCLLISRDVPHLEIGNRHLPADQPFMNGTIRGKDLFVPITSIIGGQEQAGHGWQMLVECLSIGRSISLPALGAASSSVAYLATGAYARIRRQFNVELAQFEGIEAKLAEIAGLNYLVNATRLLTIAAVNEYKKPSVASAITKYFNTELARIVINDAMDVHAGRAVVVGPRNYLVNYYQGIPISVTVEGANIMTRNLLIFGQGSMACHPFVRDEFYAISTDDKDAFQGLIWKHISYFLCNFAKTVCSAWTGGYLITVPRHALKRNYQRLARLSYAFAWMADLSLMALGGDLKRKERLSARLADGMSYLYLGMAALRYCEEREAHPDEQLHAEWALAYCFYHAQQAMMALCANFPSRLLGRLMKVAAFPFGARMQYPSDKLDHQLARLMTTNNHYREALADRLYLSGDPNEPIDRVEQAFQGLIKHADLYKKIRGIKRLSTHNIKHELSALVAKEVITTDEMETIIGVEKARWDAILVDEFSMDAMKKKTFESLTHTYSNPLD